MNKLHNIPLAISNLFPARSPADSLPCGLGFLGVRWGTFHSPPSPVSRLEALETGIVFFSKRANARFITVFKWRVDLCVFRKGEF